MSKPKFKVGTNTLVQVLKCDFTGDGRADMVVELFDAVGSAGYWYNFYSQLPNGSYTNAYEQQTVGLCVLPKKEGKGCGFLTVDKIKNPVLSTRLLEYRDVQIRETKLESAIISHLKDVLMEMGRGFSFVARQKHMRADSDDYFIDLVFYNYILKCFFLIDLKMGKVTHKDIGQMDMYRRMFDDQICGGDRPDERAVEVHDEDRDERRRMAIARTATFIARMTAATTSAAPQPIWCISSNGESIVAFVMNTGAEAVGPVK